MEFDKESALKFINKLYHHWYSDTASLKNLGDKLLNIKFLDNDQYDRWHFSGAFQTDRIKENVIPVISNMMLSFSESVKSRILALNPRPLVYASSQDHSDRVACRAYSKYLRGDLNEIHFKRKLQQLVDIQLVCKGVWVYPYWNEKKKLLDLKIMHDIMGVVDTFAEDEETCRYLMLFKIKSKKWVEKNYKLKKEIKNLDLLSKPNNVIEATLRTLQRFPYSSNRKPDIEDATLVFELMYIDDNDKPRMITALETEVLSDEPMDSFPTYIPYYMDGLKFIGRSPLDSLRGPQREINNTLTRIKSTLKRPSKMMINDEYITLPDNIETYDDTASEIFKYKSKMLNVKPEVLPPPMLNPTDLNVWVRQFGEAGGLSEASKGQLPGSQLSKIAMQFLVEQDETKIGNAKDNLAIGLSIVMTQALKIIDKHVKEGDMITLFGRKQSWEAVQYIKMKKPDIFKVNIDMGSSLPSTPGQKINLINELKQNGWFDDMPLSQRLEYCRDIADLMPYDIDNYDVDTDKQEAEIEIMIANIDGDIAQVIDVDDDIKHIKVLSEFMKTKNFMDLESIIKTQMIQHLEMHIAKMVASMPKKSNGANIPKAQGQPQASPQTQQQTQ